MAKAELKRVHKVTTKGKTYCYAWRGGPRIEAEWGTDEFLEEFLRLKNPTTNLDRKRIAAWITLYKASRDYEKLSDKTKANWAPKLDAIRDHFGKTSVRAFDRPQIRGAIKKWRDDNWGDTPRTADLAKQVLSKLCSFIISEGALSVNPCVGVPNIYKNNRADIIWTLDDLDALCKAASPEIAWAARLAVLTGLRQEALLELPWSRIEKHHIDAQATGGAGKKGRGLIPIYPALRELLDTIPKRATTVLTNSDGRPWKGGFGSSWQKALVKSGLKSKGLHFHDFRGTAATNFYRVGFSVQEIAEMMGWQSDEVEALIDRYVKRDELMLDRIRKMERA